MVACRAKGQVCKQSPSSDLTSLFPLPISSNCCETAVEPCVFPLLVLSVTNQTLLTVTQGLCYQCIRGRELSFSPPFLFTCSRVTIICILLLGYRKQAYPLSDMSDCMLSVLCCGLQDRRQRGEDRLRGAG